MKRLNGEPVVQFMICVTFAMPIEAAERIISQGTKELKGIALDAWLKSHTADETCATNQFCHDYDTFYNAYGKALAEKREKELKMLAAPAPEIHPADIENV